MLNIISGPRDPERGAGALRRSRRHRPVDRRTQHRPGVPVPGALRLDDRRAEPASSRCATGASTSAVAQRRAEEVAELLEIGHLLKRRAKDLSRRRQAARLAVPGAGPPGRHGDPLRRAADGDRSPAEVAPAPGAQACPRRAQPHAGVRHPRPDRGAHLRRQGRRHERRRGDAEGHARRAVRTARPPLRRPLHRIAGDELPALHRATTASSAWAASTSCGCPASSLAATHEPDDVVGDPARFRALRRRRADRVGSKPTVVDVRDLGTVHLVDLTVGEASLLARIAGRPVDVPPARCRVVLDAGRRALLPRRPAGRRASPAGDRPTRSDA